MKHTFMFLIFIFNFLNTPHIRSLNSISGIDLNIEPNVELAKLWWPDQRNVWTPIGWKDHYFRFNVLYNGTLIFEPFSDLSARKHAVKYKGKSFLVSFTPFPTIDIPPLPIEQRAQWRIDGGHGVQGWRTDTDAPVLWTDHKLQEGLVIRQEVFAHLAGGGDVTDGLDPLYAWIRLSVTYVDPIRAVDGFPVILQLSKNYHELVGRFLHDDGVTVDVLPDRAPYPEILNAKEFSRGTKSGLRVLEPDGAVRFVVLPTEKNKVSFYDKGNGIYLLKADLKAKVGDYVDFLLPMFPEEPQQISKEESLGFDGALTESNAYWQKDLVPITRFHVPEAFINEAIYHSLKFVPILSERDYITREYSFLSGSWGYDQLWPTPASMNSHMFLSLLGEHETVEKYTNIFRRFQGTIKPPGKDYDYHSGYYASPSYLTSIDWLADHGAILLQVATHALQSNDMKFIQTWTESIVNACDFIKEASSKTNHDGIVGLLPPAVATDAIIPTQAIWNIAWNYKGLTKAVQVLKKINHPRAEEFETFAKEQKELFVNAFRDASTKSKTWKDKTGTEYPMPPTSLSKTPPPHHAYNDAFYLDTGPLVLVWAGLLDATDPLMESIIKFFREGPNWQLKGARFNAISRPVLEHEISTCEPCYSWNVMHSWQLGDREKFLEGMYSLFVGSLSQQTYTSCEHRHGMQGTLFSIPLAFWMARMALIDDEIVENELQLLRFCPLAWISSDEETILDDLPTLYGNIKLRFSLSEDEKNLNVTFSGDWHDKPDRIVLHIPPLKELKTVTINGKKHKPRKKIFLKIE